jgi:hypothetical protein
MTNPNGAKTMTNSIALEDSRNLLIVVHVQAIAALGDSLPSSGQRNEASLIRLVHSPFLRYLLGNAIEHGTQALSGELPAAFLLLGRQGHRSLLL